MPVSQIGEIFSLGNVVSVVGVLLLIIIWGEKRWRSAEIKHDSEMKELKSEYAQIMNAIETRHQNAMQSQREAHKEEKSVFFGDLNKNLSELVNELRASFKVNSELAGLMNTIRAEQIEQRHDVATIKENILVSNEILARNSKLLEALIKPELKNSAENLR